MSGKLKPNSVSLSRKKKLASKTATASGSVMRKKNANSSSKNSSQGKKGGEKENVGADVDDEIDISNLDGASTTPITGSPYNSLGGMGMGGFGMGMMGGMNPMMMGMYGGAWECQAMQIVGMNAQQLKHMYESVKGMVENAICKLNNMSLMEETFGVNGDEARRWMLGNEEDEHQRPLTQHEIIRRRRIAAIRWSMTLGVSYLLYKSIRKLIRALLYGRSGCHRRNLPAHQQYQNFNGGGYGINRFSGYGNGYGSGFGRHGFSQHHSQYGGAHSGYY
ncbi:hypothetical protein THAOC_31366 [Thalassiosira oceanica]|uniref:Uncharacterized protein n=1 Tax=Thalassiosira oceanica TaxID=159749 RepID=K0R8D4_THAOC|nr:hypothetical protein THAOC_31366 [Thalassiosira oceanica]|eukprot:EJK49728.1 hypothetical protein THAOC_31366 [Thalassiosira oceanica]